MPFFGNLFEARRDPIGLFQRATREHGDVVCFRFGPFRYFLVNDPAGAKHVLVDNHKNYVKSRNYRGLALLLGNGLLTSEGDFWKKQRRLAQPAFHRDRLASFAAGMAEDTQAMLERWQATPPGKAVDIHAEMMRLTFRIVGKTLFSTDVESDADRVGPALTVVTRYANAYAESLLPLPPWLPTPSNLRFGRAVRTLDGVVQRIVDERRAGKEENDLLSMLMAARDADTGETMSDRQLRDEIMTLVLAGHETTANALSWLFYLLSRHPDVERRLASEVGSVLGGRMPTLADLPRLGYCANVVSEALRLYPPAWTFERQALLNDEILGFAVPKDSIVAISPFVLHRHASFWDNPEGFDPDRFAPGPSTEARSKYAYLPFGGGPRQCIGNSFALMEAQIIVAAIVQRHRLSIVSGHPVELEPIITLRPKYGIQMTIEPQRRLASRPARESAEANGAPVRAATACPVS